MAALTMAATAQQEPQYISSFKYDKRVHDFGTIKEKDGKVSHTFTFTNTSILPVVISDVNSWCGCTTAEYTKTPILPGKTAKVTVTFNPQSRPGKFSKEVVLNLDGNKGFARVWIMGTVIPSRSPPCAEGSTYRLEQRVSNETDKEMTVEFERWPNNTVLKMPSKITLKPKERTTCRVSYTAPVSHYADRHIYVRVKVNGKQVKPILVKWLGSEQRFTK